MTCPRCQASLQYVERLRTFDLTRARVVFTCGHSVYVGPPPSTLLDRPQRGRGKPGVCDRCLERFTRRSDNARRCDACLTPETKTVYRLAGVR